MLRHPRFADFLIVRSYPRVWSTRPFPRTCQTQETLARDFFHLCGLESCGDFFSGLRPLADSVSARTFLYLCPVLKPAQM
jgi:hypothetical protein